MDAKHICHAQGCTVEIPPRLLMCWRHWMKVPIPLRDAVWREYVPGQEVTKTPTREYLQAMRNAINAVAAKEGQPQLPELPGLAAAGGS